MQSFRSVVTKAGIKLVVGISEDKRLAKTFQFLMIFVTLMVNILKTINQMHFKHFFCINVS